MLKQWVLLVAHEGDWIVCNTHDNRKFPDSDVRLVSFEEATALKNEMEGLYPNETYIIAKVQLDV
jgi:hypothetical protein